MKNIFFVIILVPYFVNSQSKTRNKDNFFLSNSKAAVSINILSIFAGELQTIQLGGIFKISPKIITTTEFGIPIRFAKNESDSITSWFTHFKIKSSVMYKIKGKDFYVGCSLFFTDVNKLYKCGRFRDNTGQYGFTSGKLDEIIFGYGIKIEKFISLSNRFYLSFSSLLGQRFVNAKINAKTQYPDTFRADWVDVYDRMGKFNTVHMEFGLKFLYTF